eukprot:2277623-Pyramimonas_sp.AAC.1
MWLGPQVKLESLADSAKKWRAGGRLLAQSASPHRVMAHSYDVLAVSVMSFVAQFMPLPAAVLPQESALMPRLWHAAHCAIPRGGWFNLWRLNGP